MSLLSSSFALSLPSSTIVTFSNVPRPLATGYFSNCSHCAYIVSSLLYRIFDRITPKTLGRNIRDTGTHKGLQKCVYISTSTKNLSPPYFQCVLIFMFDIHRHIIDTVTVWHLVSCVPVAAKVAQVDRYAVNIFHERIVLYISPGSSSKCESISDT